MKFKPLRLFISRIKNIFRVMADKKISPDVCGSWNTWASFSTTVRDRPELGAQNENRIGNMRLSCGILDCILIEPGKCFSMMKWIGEADENKGYKKGPMLMRGALSADYGGGLCQVSTTIFNAALLAGLRIVEKHNHSTDVWGDARMVELGRDAAYVFARKDLIFKNNSPHPVCLRIRLGQNDQSLTAAILSPGEKILEQSITVRIIREIPCRKKGTGIRRSGWVTETVRTKGGRITFRKRERYKPVLLPPEKNNE